MGLAPGVLLLSSVTAPAGTSAEELEKTNCGLLEISQEAAFLLSITEILNRHLGFGLSLRQGVSVLGDGRPIPLISYSLTEYLLSLDLSDCDVLELGGGQSTFFWAGKTRTVRTLEHGADWFENFDAAKLGNVEVVRVEPDGYAAAAAEITDDFDIIVIDCSANRFDCAVALAGRLRPGGFIILDNSDWYPNTAAQLRGQNLVQIDYPDFRPSHHYRCTTSLFLHPEFRPKVKPGPHPPPPLGGKHIAALNTWDVPTANMDGRAG